MHYIIHTWAYNHITNKNIFRICCRRSCTYLLCTSWVCCSYWLQQQVNYLLLITTYDKNHPILLFIITLDLGILTNIHEKSLVICPPSHTLMISWLVTKWNPRAHVPIIIKQYLVWLLNKLWAEGPKVLGILLGYYE